MKEVNPKAFLKFVDIATIPVLVTKERSGITLITGDQMIIAHFETERETDIPAVGSLPAEIQSNTPGLSADFLSAGGDEGCALSITETPSCEDDNITTQ